MLTLILAVSVAVVISFTCSLTEAALYAVPWSAIEKIRNDGRPVGEVLFRLRSNVEKPIAAILTLNTVANTAGSAVAGAAFMAAFGAEYMALFAAGFTVLILAFGEIVPKTLGVAYATSIAVVLARPLEVAVKLLTPVIWLTGLLTRLLTPPSNGPDISEDDIRAVTSLSRQAGQIKAYEEAYIHNILALDQKRVYDIMTPRTVVFSLPEDMTAAEAYKNPRLWHVSRIPVYGEDNEDLVGLVDRRTILHCLLEEKGETPLSEIMKPLHFVLESQTLDKLLKELLHSRSHLFAVLDEYGGLAGVVTLEDVFEEMLGSEIMDESDSVADLRQMARQRRQALRAAGLLEQQKKLIGEQDEEIRRLNGVVDEQVVNIARKGENIIHLEHQVDGLMPKAIYSDNVLDSVSCFTTTQVAKELGVTAQELNRSLCALHIQYYQSGQYMLYAEYAHMGLAKSRTRYNAFLDPNCDGRKEKMGKAVTHTYLVWTEKGRKFIHDLAHRFWELAELYEVKNLG